MLVEPKAWGGRVSPCRGGRPEAFATAMALPAVDATVNIPPTGQPLDFGATLYSDERRLVTSTWDWARGRFVSRGGTPHPKVSLETLSTVRPSAADIYRITVAGCGTASWTAGTPRYSSRTAAPEHPSSDSTPSRERSSASPPRVPAFLRRSLPPSSNRSRFRATLPCAGERTFETPCRSDDAVVVVGGWVPR